MTESSFTCPRCTMTSRNSMDVKYGYCGSCHDWTGDFNLSRIRVRFNSVTMRVEAYAGDREIGFPVGAQPSLLEILDAFARMSVDFPMRGRGKT